MLPENFVKTLQDSLKNNWDLPAFSNYGSGHLNYGDVAKEIRWMHDLFKECGIKKDDKIALVGKNSVNWGVTFLAAVTYGAVIVPILPDFSPDDMTHIVNHSDSVLFFTAEAIFDTLDESEMPELEGVFSLESMKLLYHKKKDLPGIVEKTLSARTQRDANFSKESIQFPEISNAELAAIVYTSGTTGFSKGVMLQHNSLMANVRFAWNNIALKRGDRILSFMPLAHSYGCAFEFLFPFTIGCHITFLSKTPSPKIIVKAFQDVKPNLILSVPLIIEKIYKKQIKPAISKGAPKYLLKTPVLQNIVHKKVYNKLMDVFGNNFLEIVIGGAAFNEEVEAFLRKVGFPYTVGYGMTECGPLISYSNWDKNRFGAIGQRVDTLEIKIDSEDPEKQVGEILVKGENVMMGYYKNEKATKETIEPDGWMHTGDLGLIDKDGFVYIKGRSKNMILGPSGQNIYPEEVEAKLNNMPYVQESLVIEKNDKLVALVYPDLEMTDAEEMGEADITEIMEENRKALNALLPGFISISKIELYPEEFEKTPTKKIKRFMYSH